MYVINRYHESVFHKAYGRTHLPVTEWGQQSPPILGVFRLLFVPSLMHNNHPPGLRLHFRPQDSSLGSFSLWFHRSQEALPFTLSSTLPRRQRFPKRTFWEGRQVPGLNSRAHDRPLSHIPRPILCFIWRLGLLLSALLLDYCSFMEVLISGEEIPLKLLKNYEQVLHVFLGWLFKFFFSRW